MGLSICRRENITSGGRQAKLRFCVAPICLLRQALCVLELEESKFG